jgi:hypothetical protein
MNQLALTLAALVNILLLLLLLFVAIAGACCCCCLLLSMTGQQHLQHTVAPHAFVYAECW